MRTFLSFSLAALAAILSLPAAPTAAQSDDGTTVEIAILDIMLERGLIDADEYEELLALARAKVESERNELDVLEGRLERLRAPDVQASGGKGGKLTFASPDGTWSMNIKGRLQARVTDLDHDDDVSGGTNFSVPRARIGLKGKAGSKAVDYKLEFDMGTDKKLYDEDSGDDNEAKSLNVRSAYVDFEACEGASFQLGQFKFPFGREELISSGSISLMERGVASGEFAPGYEPGAMLHGGCEDGRFAYFVAMSNGDGTGLSNAQEDDGDGLRSGVRFEFNPLGSYKADGPAFQTVEDGSTKLGIGVSLMQNKDNEAKNDLAQGTDTETTGIDLQVLNGPFSILAEMFDRSSDPAGGTDVDDDGHTLQVGYFVVPNEWEIVARTSEVDYDVDADVEETTLGVNRYLLGHAAKWMFDINKRDKDGASADTTEIRVQYQAIF
ncbi:MAG: porin [Planctomycetota bacterium]